MGVGAHHGVGEGAQAPVALVLGHHAREVLEIHLVDDAGVGRHHLEVLECLLSPAQEGVAFTVALELDLRVGRERTGAAEGIDLHRVVDDQFRGRQRIDLPRVAAQRVHRVAHRGEVDQRGHPGEILQDHPGGSERNLGRRFGGRVPARERLDIVSSDARPVFVAQQVLEQNLERAG